MIHVDFEFVFAFEIQLGFKMRSLTLVMSLLMETSTLFSLSYVQFSNSSFEIG